MKQCGWVASGLWVQNACPLRNIKFSPQSGAIRLGSHFPPTQWQHMSTAAVPPPTHQPIWCASAFLALHAQPISSLPMFPFVFLHKKVHTKSKRNRWKISFAVLPLVYPREIADYITPDASHFRTPLQNDCTFLWSCVQFVSKLFACFFGKSLSACLPVT